MKRLVMIVMLLSGCSPGPQPDPKIVIQKVEAPVSKPCVPPDVPQAPTAYPDETLTPDMDPAARYLAVAAGVALRKARLQTIEPIISGCRR